jgi:hypothetical protein
MVAFFDRDDFLGAGGSEAATSIFAGFGGGGVSIVTGFSGLRGFSGFSSLLTFPAFSGFADRSGLLSLEAFFGSGAAARRVAGGFGLRAGSFFFVLLRDPGRLVVDIR